MEVALFLTFDYSLKTWDESGTLNRELKIYKKLSESRGIKFKFFTYGNSEDLKYLKIVKNSEIIPIYSNQKISKYKIIRYLNSFLIPLKLKKHLQSVDLIKQNQLMGSWVSIICSVLYKKPYYLRSGYDMYQFSIFERKHFSIVGLYKLLTYFSIKFSNLYSVTSNKDFAFLNTKFSISKKNIVIRPNWVQRVNIPNKDRFENRILCVGRLCYQKNFEYIIKEFKNTENILTLDFVGSGEEITTLKESAKTNHVSVNFLDQMSHSALMNLYPKYKFYITSSLFEGHPKSLLEALSSGCVVFASDIISHREIIEDNETGIIFQLKDNSLSEVFMKVKENYDLINKISKNAERSMNDNYSLEKLIKQTYNDYKSLI